MSYYEIDRHQSNVLYLRCHNVSNNLDCGYKCGSLCHITICIWDPCTKLVKWQLILSAISTSLDANILRQVM